MQRRFGRKETVSKMAYLMSTSLKVVSIAQVFCASLSLWAILSLMRFIFTCDVRIGGAQKSTHSQQWHLTFTQLLVLDW